VLATIGAFFVTTRLKRSTPVVEQLTFRRYFSPNGDGRFDAALFSFRLRRTDDVTVAVVNRDGDEIRTLAEDVELRGGHRHRFRWDGRTGAGPVAADGEYHLRVGLRRQGRTVTSPLKLFLDTVPPRPVVRYVAPDSISPDGAGAANSARLRFTGPSRRARLRTSSVHAAASCSSVRSRSLSAIAGSDRAGAQQDQDGDHEAQDDHGLGNRHQDDHGRGQLRLLRETRGGGRADT